MYKGVCKYDMNAMYTVGLPIDCMRVSTTCMQQQMYAHISEH